MKESTRYKLNISINSFVVLACTINVVSYLFSAFNNKLGIAMFALSGFSVASIIFVSIALLRDVKYLWKMKKQGLNFCEFCGGVGYGYTKYNNNHDGKMTTRKEFNICVYCKGTGKIDWIQKARGFSIRN